MSSQRLVLSSAPQLPDVALNIYSKSQPAQIRLAETRIATKSASPNVVRHITFDVGGTELEGQFR
ncbi:MAG: hypothetical protein ACOC2C_08405, partial [Cyclonatronaceae bacterium]